MDGRRHFERRPEYKDEPELPVWPSLVEKLLLSIIDANTVDMQPASDRAADQNRQKRLDDALEALFGIQATRGNSVKYLLHGAVLVADYEVPKASASAFEKAILDLPPEDRTKALSKRKTREKFESEIDGASSEAREQRLERFERQHRNYLQHVAQFRDHPEEEDMFRDLQTIGRILRKWNAAYQLDAEAVGMASLWGRK